MCGFADDFVSMFVSCVPESGLELSTFYGGQRKNAFDTLKV